MSVSIMNTKRKVHSLIAILVASGALACQSMAATIVADFTGGNSTTVVDAWRGKPGDGWARNWGSSVNSSGVQSVTTVPGSLLSGTAAGNYLRSTLTRESGTPSAVVYRQYENYEDVKVAEGHVVSFELRLDSALSDLNRLLLFDGQEGSRDHTGSATKPSWMIRYDMPTKEGDNDNLFVYDGTSRKDTGVAFVTGNVYRFTISINPGESQYKLLIENLTTPASKYESSDWLDFYTKDGTVGGYLNFAGQAAGVANAQVIMSLDSIHIDAIPEPSSVALLGLTLGGAWLVKRGFRKP